MLVSYVYIRRGMPSRPVKCMGKKVRFMPANISQKVIFPTVSSYMRPVNFGNQ